MGAGIGVLPPAKGVNAENAEIMAAELDNVIADAICRGLG